MEDPRLFCDVDDAAKMTYDPCMGFLHLNKIDATPDTIRLADEAIAHYRAILDDRNRLLSQSSDEVNQILRLHEDVAALKADLAEAQETIEALGDKPLWDELGNAMWEERALKAEDSRTQLRDALERQKAYSKFLSDTLAKERSRGGVSL